MGSTNSVGNQLQNMINMDSMKEKALKGIEERKKVVEDRLDKNTEKISDLEKLNNLVTNFKSTIVDLMNPYKGPFNSTSVNTTTQDLGYAADFLDISSKPNAEKRSYNVAVNRLAEPSKMRLEYDGGGALNNNGAGINGTLTLNVGANTLDIVFDGTETVTGIVSKINEQLKANGYNFEAFAMHVPGQNTSYVEIKGKEGAIENISFNNFAIADVFSDFLKQQSQTDRTTAQITIDGMQFEGDSNKFEEIIDGMTFTAKKVNANNMYQTVSVGAADPTAFRELFENKIAPAFNELQIFMAKHSREVNIDKPDEGPAIDRERILLSEVQTMLMRFGQSKALEDIGVALQTNVSGSEDMPSGLKTLAIIDHRKYEEAMKDLDKVRSMFITETSFAKGNNAGDSSLTMMPDIIGIKHTFPAWLEGKDIKISIDQNVGNAVTATLPDNSVVNGIYDNGSITFAEGTGLESVELVFNAGTVAGRIIEYTINRTQGLTSRVMAAAFGLVNDVGDGSIKRAIDSARNQEKTITRDLENVESKYSAEVAKFDAWEGRIKHMDIIGSIFQDNIDKLFGFGN